MKKIITALMILMALMCFTACQPEDGGDPTPSFDPNTLDGYYVATAMICGKPVNMNTFIIKGNSLTYYTLDGAEVIDENFLDSVTQKKEWTKTIERGEDLTFTITGEQGTYSVTTENGVTSMTCDSGFFIPLLKVAKGTTGTPFTSMDIFIGTGNKSLSLVTTPMGSSDWHGVTVRFGEVEYESLSAAITDNVYTVTGVRNDSTDEDTDEAAFIVTVSTGAAVISGVQNFPDERNPADTYTRLVRTTPWPIAE